MKRSGKALGIFLVIAGMTLTIFGFGGGTSAQAATLALVQKASDDSMDHCEEKHVEIGGNGYINCLERGESDEFFDVRWVCNHYERTVSVEIREHHWEDEDEYSLDEDECITLKDADAEISILR